MAGNSESVKKSEATKKEKYGPDYHARNGSLGGRNRGRGYFGMLKDTGQTDKLKELAHNAAVKSNEVQGSKRATKRKGTRVRNDPNSTDKGQRKN